MQTVSVHPKDEWIARGVSLALHAILLFFITMPMFQSSAKTTVLLTVETVSGSTPLGEGTGAEGTQPNVTDAPTNTNPLLNGVKMKMDETAPAQSQAKAQARPVPALPPTLSDLEKRYASMPLGVTQPGQDSDALSEGGMGNSLKAGSPNGVAVGGQIGGRGFAAPNLTYPGNLPEETELQIDVVVTPDGGVADARVGKSSGYDQLDQFALNKSREFRFDPLAASETQENKTGVLYFKFQYGGVVTVQ